MKKVIYIPNQKKEAYFDKGTPDWEQKRKVEQQQKKLRQRRY